MTHYDPRGGSWRQLDIEFVSEYSRLSLSRRQREILRDICTSTYQICRIEEKLIEQPHFTNEYVIWLLMLFIYWNYCGKEEKLLLRSNFFFFYTIFCYLLLDFHVKKGTRFPFRDKRLFDISAVEITRVECNSVFYLKMFYTAGDRLDACKIGTKAPAIPSQTALLITFSGWLFFCDFIQGFINYLNKVSTSQISPQYPNEKKMANPKKNQPIGVKLANFFLYLSTFFCTGRFFPVLATFSILAEFVTEMDGMRFYPVLRHFHRTSAILRRWKAWHGHIAVMKNLIYWDNHR